METQEAGVQGCWSRDGEDLPDTCQSSCGHMHALVLTLCEAQVRLPHPESSLVYRQDFCLGDSAGGKMDLWPGLHQGPEKASWMLGMCLLE